MKHTVRDVVLLGAAMSAFMLLVVLAPVGAEELPAAEVRVAVDSPAASATAATAVRLAANVASPTQRSASTTAGPAVESRQAVEPAADSVEIERPCDHVRRIGKFRFTRCD